MTRVLTDSWNGTIRIAELVLKLAEARAEAIKNPVRDLVAFLVLGRLARAYQVGSIATPPNRTAKTKHFCGDLQPIQLQIPGGIPEFFLQVVILFSGQGCPTLEAIVWRARRVMGGSSKLHGLLGFVIEQLQNTDSFERDVRARSIRAKVSQAQNNFCAAHTDLGCENIFLDATAHARSMTAKVLRLEELN